MEGARLQRPPLPPRPRTGLLPLLVPALVVLPLAGLALWYGAWRWFQADARDSLSRRLAATTVAAERQVDAAVQRQVDATRTLATSPTTWLWVKFQGQRLTVSNRAHEEAALASLTSFSGLVPGLSLFLASERTHTVYQAGSAVAAITRDDPAAAWYAASLASDGVIVSGDSQGLRTSMRVMNGRQLIGAVSCITDIRALAAGAFGSAEQERDFTFVLADQAGNILAGSGPRASEAARAADLVDAGQRPRLDRLLASPARAGEISTAELSFRGRQALAFATLAGAPGWRILVLADIPGLPLTRTLLLICVAAAALLLTVGALYRVGSRRARQTQALLDSVGRQLDSAEQQRDSLERDRDAARELARELGSAALRLKEAARQLGDRAGALASEAASGKAGSREALRAIQEAEEKSAELRSGITARLPLLEGVASGIRQFVERTREDGPDRAGRVDKVTPTESHAPAAVAAAAGAEEEINVVLTNGSAVTLALDSAGRSAEAMEAAVERARLVALNAALESSRHGSRRRGSAQAADEMRKIAEEAASAARSLVAVLEEARGSMRAVSRAAQEAGRMSHQAAAALRQEQAGAGSAGEPQAPGEGPLAPGAPPGPAPEDRLESLESQLARLEAANVNAGVLRQEAASSDRSRSAAEGVARIMERVEALCGEIAALASTVSRETSAAASRAAIPGSSSDGPARSAAAGHPNHG